LVAADLEGEGLEVEAGAIEVGVIAGEEVSVVEEAEDEVDQAIGVAEAEEGEEEEEEEEEMV
jgi:hypothetical protein